MENLKNGIDMLVDDVSLIRMSQYFVYNDARKLKKAKRMIANEKNCN